MAKGVGGGQAEPSSFTLGVNEEVCWEKTTSASLCPCLCGWVHGRTCVLGTNLFMTDRLSEVSVMVSPSDKGRLEYITQAETGPLRSQRWLSQD